MKKSKRFELIYTLKGFPGRQSVPCPSCQNRFGILTAYKNTNNNIIKWFDDGRDGCDWGCHIFEKNYYIILKDRRNEKIGKSK